MTNIDWRAFWTSFATIMICLVIYFTVIDPLIKKYKIQVVRPDEDKTPTEKKS